MSITRYSFTNPTSTDVRIDVAGDFYVIEDMTDDDPEDRTLVHPGDASGNDGVPTIKRSKVVYPQGFEFLTVSANSGATATNTVYILIGHTRDVHIDLPDS